MGPGGEVLDNNSDGSESDLSASASECTDSDAEEQKKDDHLNVKKPQNDDNLSARSIASQNRRKKFGDNRSSARLMHDENDKRDSDKSFDS